MAIARRALIALSILYAAGIGLLVVLHARHIGAFAAVGGIVLGAAWALRALLVSTGPATHNPDRPD